MTSVTVDESLFLRLTCTRCTRLIAVMEIPAGHLDQRRYRCGDCLEQLHQAHQERRNTQPDPVAYGEIPF